CATLHKTFPGRDNPRCGVLPHRCFEYLSRIDQVRVANLVLVRFVDDRVAEAGAVKPAGNVPQVAARLDDDLPFSEGRQNRLRLTPLKGHFDAAGHATLTIHLIDPERIL